MDSNLDKIAADLYGKIQTRFSDIKIGDETTKVLSKEDDIPRARFFEFQYEEGGEPLGTVAITLDAKKGVVVQVSGDLVNDDDETTHHGAYQWLRSFRQFAKDRLMNFKIINLSKSNLDKRDYEFQAKRKELQMEPMMESKMYGNAKMSYQDLGEARLVVKHSQPVNTELAAGRTMHIESIYIENAVGERFRYPFKHLNGARALAEHIKAGGNPYDGIGKHITGLSEELASLRKFKGYVGRQEQVSEAMGSVTGKVIDRIQEIKETIHKLQRPAYYQAFAESFVAQDEVMIPEEVQNDLIDRLTIRTFNEELKSVFPYIAKFVNENELEVIELGADDLLDEVFDGDKETGTTHRGGRVTKTAHGVKHEKTDYEDGNGEKGRKPTDDGPKSRYHKTPILDPEDQFESFMDSLMQEDNDLFSPNKDAQQTAIEKLNQIMTKELKGGPEGINAVQSLKGIIDDPEFLGQLRDVDPDLDVRPLIQQFINSNAPEIAVQLNFGGEEGGAKEPEVPPAAPPEAGAVPPAAPPEAGAVPPAAPPEAGAVPPEAGAAPVAEGKDDDQDPPWDVDPKDKKTGKTTPGKFGQGYSQARHLARQGMADTLKKAKKAGATLETQLDLGHGVKTIAEIIDECGMQPQDVGFEQQGGLDDMIKYVSGFWNREEHNFPLGGERIKIKVEKEFEDGKFGGATPDDLQKVLAFIDKKDPGVSSNNGEQKHILRLAGIGGQDREVDESPDDAQLGKLNDMLAQFGSMQHGATNRTSSGTVNGKPASYDDAMAAANNMKFKLPAFGDGDTETDLDMSNPQDMVNRMQGKMGGMMQGMMGKMPNQNISMPGAQMNPADMMKGIMGKINFGK